MDTTRLARAVHLTSKADGSGRWIVSGGAEPHLVTTDAAGELSCMCIDASMRAGVECKHVLKVRLMRGDVEVLDALRELVPVPKVPRPRQKRAQ